MNEVEQRGPGGRPMSVVTDEVARIRAERVRIVGNDCCHGSDPACAAGCIFAEAVRNIISNVEPEPAPGAEPVGYGVLVHGYDESKPPAIGRARDKWKVDEFFYPFQRAKAVEACKEVVPEARAHVVPLYASPPSERAGPKPEPIGRCADCGSHETPVGEYPLTSCISCGAPWRNYAREERAGERELREALEEIAAFGCGWDRSNVNPCTKRYASRKEWCAPCIARRALAAAPAPERREDAMSQMGEPARIYLQPECCATPDVGRLWCEDDEPVECEEGRPWTEYVRADLAGDPVLAASVAAGMLERHIAALSEARFKCDGTREVSMSWRDAMAFLRALQVPRAGERR